MCTTVGDRFWKRVRKGSVEECWEWKGPLTDTGRGRFSLGRRYGLSTSASRSSWILTYGPVPLELFVCHKCDNPKCCNPSHLFLGTPQDNLDDMRAKGRSNISSSYKLSIPEMIEIKESRLTRSKLSEKYRVSKNTVSRIRSGRTRLK